MEDFSDFGSSEVLDRKPCNNKTPRSARIICHTYPCAIVVKYFCHLNIYMPCVITIIMSVVKNWNACMHGVWLKKLDA